MSTSNLSEIFRDLFTAPVHAALEAEVQYRRIWIEWLKNLKALVTVRDELKPEEMKAFIESQLSLAPVMRLEARIDVGVSLRVTNVRQTQFGGTFGIQVSVLQAAGTYSLASQDTQESVLHARATYALANTQQLSLKDFLDKAIIRLDGAADFEKALKFLETKTPTSDNG